MTVRVFMKVNFDDNLPLTEVKDIMMRGEFFSCDVVSCEVVAMTEKSPSYEIKKQINTLLQ